jgi:uncharacterized membrane protein YhaH (DUF805 family)
MSTALFKIVFEGGSLPGVEPETAKANLAQLFKSDLLAIEKLFTGHKVALKRNLPQETAEKYLSALHQAGVDARIEAEQPIDLTLDDVSAEPSPSASPYAPPRANVGDTFTEYGELKVFTLHGRIGRLRYLAWTMVLTFVLMTGLTFCTLLLHKGGLVSAFLSMVFWVGAVVVGIQISVQRLHDIGWSGWLVLLNLVPFVNSVFALIMMLAPGTPGVSQYGPPPPPNSTGVKVLASLWLLVILLLVVAFTLGLSSALMNHYGSATSL